MLIEQRDRAYEVARRCELLYDDAKNGMDVAVIRRAEEQAAAAHEMTLAAHRLNKLAAAFFPIATLGAIFGTTLTDNWSWSRTAGPFALFLDRRRGCWSCAHVLCWQEPSKLSIL